MKITEEAVTPTFVPLNIRVESLDELRALVATLGPSTYGSIGKEIGNEAYGSSKYGFAASPNDVFDAIGGMYRLLNDALKKATSTS